MREIPLIQEPPHEADDKEREAPDEATTSARPVAERRLPDCCRRVHRSQSHYPSLPVSIQSWIPPSLAALSRVHIVPTFVRVS